MKTFLRVTVACTALGAAVGVVPALAYTGQDHAAEAKISMAQAGRIALKAQPGTITDRELEREGGGSGLRYSFDIRSGEITHEVGVDAKTGAVLENSIEGPGAD